MLYVIDYKQDQGRAGVEWASYGVENRSHLQSWA